MDRVTLQGYACRFGTTHQNSSGRWQRLRHDCFGSTPLAWRLCLDHDRSRSFASWRDGTLRAWVDPLGVGIEATVDDWIAEEVRSGRRACLSIGSTGRLLSEPHVEAADRIVHIISAMSVDEVSLVYQGGCGDARCWLADDPDEFLPPMTQHLRRQFHAGRAMANFRPSPKPAARKRPVPASTLAIIRSAWFQAHLNDHSRRRMHSR